MHVQLKCLGTAFIWVRKMKKDWSNVNDSWSWVESTWTFILIPLRLLDVFENFHNKVLKKRERNSS